MKKKVLVLSTYDTFFLKNLIVGLVKNCEKDVEFKFFLVEDYLNIENILVKFLSFGFFRSIILIIINFYRKITKKCLSNVFYNQILKGKNLEEIEGEIKKTDLILSINYPHLIPQKYIGFTKFGGINHHLGKLPNYAGRYPVAKAIINKDDKIFITIHSLTKSFDSGKILSETIVDISDLKNNFFRIYERIFKYSLRPISNSLNKKNTYSSIDNKNKIRIKNLKILDFFKLYFLSSFKF